jgi:hypothetical protein
MKHSLSPFLGTVLLLLAACGGQTTTPTATLAASGTFVGTTWSFVDAVSGYGSADDGQTTDSNIIVTLTNVGGLCRALQTGLVDGAALSLTLRVTAAGASLPLGTFVLPTAAAPYEASAFYTPGCNEGAQVQATSGTLTIDAASDGFVRGSFDLTFSTGDHASGAFVAPQCGTNAPIACTGAWDGGSGGAPSPG